MNIKGGYKLIDFKETNITVGGDAVTVAGVYNAIESAYRKQIVLTGLLIGGVEHRDVFCNLEHGENVYHGLFGMTANNKFLFISITNENAVTITEHELTLA